MWCQPRTNLTPAHIQRLPPSPEGVKGTAGAQVTDTKQRASDRWPVLETMLQPCSQKMSVWWGWARLQDIFMTHKLNDFKETFSRGGIHQALMNSWKGGNANVASGNGKWVRRMERQEERAEGGGRKLSSRWWMRVVAEALRRSLSHRDRLLWP